jgi:SnoaL-like domain
MHKHALWFALIVCGIAGLSSAGRAQSVTKLSTQDYVDLQQLTGGYPYKIDKCTNSGYDYADQYTDDAVFGVSSEWGSAGKVWFKGREELARAGGGGKDGCRPRWTAPGRAEVHHIVTSQVFMATADGVKGKSTLMAVTSATADTPAKIEWQGGYEDAYVKTAKGWRFKSRFHVWPGHPWPDTAAEQMKLMTAPPAPAQSPAPAPK